MHKKNQVNKFNFCKDVWACPDLLWFGPDIYPPQRGLQVWTVPSHSSLGLHSCATAWEEAGGVFFQWNRLLCPTLPVQCIKENTDKNNSAESMGQNSTQAQAMKLQF